MKNISEVLKNTREDLELTQIEVMRRTGINNKTLSGYENGISEPDLEIFAKLLKLYNLSADYVLEISEIDDNHKIDLNQEEKSLVCSFRKLDKRQREDLLIMIEALNLRNK